MSDSFVATLRAEHSRLKDQLAATPEYRRMLAIESVLDLYGEVVTSGRPEVATAIKPPRAGTIAAAVVDVAERYLRQKGSRAQTPEIAAEVQKAGYMTESANLIAAVSSYLSAAKDKFDNVRGEGYGLIEWLAVTPQQMREIGAIPPQARMIGEQDVSDDADLARL